MDNSSNLLFDTNQLESSEISEYHRTLPTYKSKYPPKDNRPYVSHKTGYFRYEVLIYLYHIWFRDMNISYSLELRKEITWIRFEKIEHRILFELVWK